MNNRPEVFLWAAILMAGGVFGGCVSNTINMSSGSGKHELGPEDANKWESSKDSQSSTDSISRLESKISGIDKSQNEITESIEKSSELQQQQLKRDEAVDRKNPNLPKEQRRELYKSKQ